MLGGSDAPLHVAAKTVDPYLHLDNRGLIVYDGFQGVLFPSAMLGWVRETVKLLAEEKRATRRQGDHVLGGMVTDDGTAVLYGGQEDALISVKTDVSALGQIYEALGGK
jgi:hypothetical protein